MTRAIETAALDPDIDLRRRPSRLHEATIGFARRKPIGAVSAVFILIVVAGAVLADLIAPHEWDLVNNRLKLQGPSGDYLFGTDQFGRDIFSRMLRGARVSLEVGLGATIVGVGIATIIGVVSAYAGGIVDYLMQRLVDVMQSIPPLILLVSIIIVLGPGLDNMIIALSVRTAFVSSRVARGSTLSVKSQAYIEAARAVGAGAPRIIMRYVMPNIAAPMIVIATITLGANILAEASLSFLGYGIPPPEPSWGGMLGSQERRFMTIAPWMLIAPALALTLLVFAVNMLGDAVRDVLDPRLRGT